MGANWLSALANVGGRLLPAAEQFVIAEGEPLPGTGPEAVRWLAARVEAFVDRDTDDAEDDRFVEGAGAFLGLLLIDHFGGRARERDGRHRVQLGPFGWFDPFTAILDALDAEDPTGQLASSLAIAEREVSGDGPVSWVLRIFVEALEVERPELHVDSCFELTVDLDNGASVDLARLERVAQDRDASATADAARRIIRMLPGSERSDATPWSEAADRLLPRLVSSEFLASLPSDQRLYSIDVAGDVHLTFQLRYGSRSRYVRASEVEAWPVNEHEIRERALDNLRARSKALRLEPTSGGLLRARQGDGLDGARLLLPDLARRLDRVAEATWIAASPHRDILLLARGDAVAELRRQAEDAVRRAPHPVSAVLFELTPDGPRPLRVP